MIHLDSSFLIDLHRETVTGRPSGALDWIESVDPDDVLGVSVHVVCQLRTGAELSRQALRERRVLTASDSTSNTLSESPQPRHASVMLWP